MKEHLQKLLAGAAIASMFVRSAVGVEPHSVAGQTLERLRSEAVLEWQAMARKLTCSRFDYTIREADRKGKSSREQTKRVSGQVVGDLFLFRETLVPGNQISIYGRNDRYEFALVRNGSSPWTISWQSSRRDEETPVGSACAYLGGMLHLPWSISDTPLERLVNDSRFSIQGLRQVDSGNLQIDFSVAPAAAQPDSLQRLASGSIVLAPAHHWALQRYSAHYANNMSSSLKVAYGPSGPPELSRVEFELNFSPEAKSMFSIDVNKYDWAAVRSDQFTLPAFGLPDYREPLNTRRCVVFVNLGIALVLLGVIVWRRRRETSDDSLSEYQ